MGGALLASVCRRLQELTPARCGGVALFVPDQLARHATLAAQSVAYANARAAVRVVTIPAELDPAMLLLSVSGHIGAGRLKLSEHAALKSRTIPFDGSLDIRGGQSVDDPLRAALILTVALCLDDASFSPTKAA